MKNAIILIIVAVMVFGTMYLSNAHDHTLFYSVPEGEITVVETDCPIYLPKGAYIIGECHNYSVDEGIVFDDTLPENQALKFEKLVKVYGEAVIYWSLDQKDEAKKMLLDS